MRHDLQPGCAPSGGAASPRWDPAPRSARAALALLAGLALALGCGPARPAPERIVLVTIDTLRADRVGCYGAARAHTPTLDGLAAGGARVEVALAPTPLTLPSHATLMTGLDPDRHGVRHNSVFKLADGVPTLAERMRGAGWATAAFVGAFVLERRFGLARGFDHYDDGLGARRSSAGVGFAERRAGEVVDAALAWAERAPERFLLWVHFYDPHYAYDPPAGFDMRFPGDPYAGEIAYADAQVGRLLDGLRRRFDAAGTLVVVTSDHGESLGEHGEATHSYGVYEATQRIPMLWQGPGFEAGRVLPGLARLADVGPTLLAVAGLEPFPAATGRDLRDAPAGPAGFGYHETLATHLDFGWSPLFAVRSERWKYVRAPRPQLFDLEADPRETRDVLTSHPVVAAELSSWLEARVGASSPLALDTGALDAADRARLEALGYVVPAEGAGAGRVADLGGPDPKDGLPLLAALANADRLAAIGQHAEAYARLAELPPAGPMFAAVRAAHALNAGLAEPAERDVRAALAAEPERPEYLVILARSLEVQQRAAEAAAVFERAAAADPSAAAPLLGLGRLREAEGDRAGAARHYEQALERAPDDAEAIWRLAALRLDAGETDAARALLEAAPPPPDLLLALRVAAHEADAGEAARGAVRVESALGTRSPPPTLAGPAAAVLELGGRLERALDLREEALAREPGEWARQNEVAWTLARLGRDLERALALAESAAAGSGGDPSALDTLATVLAARGEPARARAVADRALRVAESGLRARLLFLRAATLAAEGRPAEARRDLDEALASPPSPLQTWRPEAEALARQLGSPRESASVPGAGSDTSAGEPPPPP